MNSDAPKHSFLAGRGQALALAASFAATIVANLCGCGGALAQGLPEPPAEPAPAVAVRWFGEVGVCQDTTSAAVGFARDWSPQWQLGGHTLTSYYEGVFGRWQVSSGARVNHAGSYWVGLTPILRWWGGDRRGWFAEAGIGANLIGPLHRTTDRQFTTAFNFGDHIGIGWRSAGEAPWDISLRVSHYSNASIKKPNPGENFLRLRFAAPF